jgi:hypothetical protein
MAVIILARGSQSYPGVASTSQGSFGVTEVSFLLPYPSCHLGLLRISSINFLSVLLLQAGFTPNVNSAGPVCDQKTSKFFVPCGRIHGRICWHKWSLLKVREGKYKRGAWLYQVESGGQEDSCSFRFYKTKHTDRVTAITEKIFFAISEFCFQLRNARLNSTHSNHVNWQQRSDQMIKHR